VVILENTRIRGILRGNSEGRPQIVGILSDQRIQPGEKVLTAGGDQIFPRGLPVGVVEKVVRDPDRDAFINVVVKPAADLDRLDEVLIITSTEPRFSPQQQQDVATSEQLKGAEAADLAEKKKASEIMAERLPGLKDGNAPIANPAATKPGEAGTNGTPPAPIAPAVPKILPPQHPDRFTPGNAVQPPASSEPGQTPTRPAAPAKPGGGNTPGAKQAEKAKPAEKKEAAPSGGDTSAPPQKPPAKNDRTPQPNPPPQPQRNL
jgi:rod shape-determining protein MreC